MECGIFHNPTMQCSVNCITAECLSVMTQNDDDKEVPEISVYCSCNDVSTTTQEH